MDLKHHKVGKKNIARRKRFIFKSNNKHADFLLLFTIFFLTVFGLIMVYNSSIVEAQLQFEDKFHYLKYQSIYFILGWIGLITVSHIDYHYYKKIIKYLFLGNLFLLVIVLIPGIGLKTYGARRWIDLGITTYQPTETFKTILILYLASWFDKKPNLTQFFFLMAFILGLVILEPDLGTAIVLISSSFILYYISGANIIKFAGASFLAFILGLVLILASPYRRQRLMTFLNPQNDNLSASYHIQQITLAIGSGGITGLGFGQSKQKYQYLPEAMTDSIFAIVGEETGFIGSVALVFSFLIIIYKGFKIAQTAPDLYGRLTAAGITSWLATQVFVNLSAMVSLIPLTGVPFPFLSYGGTSLVVTLLSIGILLNISKQTTS